MAKKIPTQLGNGGAHLNNDLKALLEEVVNSLNSLKTQVDDLQTTYNANNGTSPDSTVTSTISITK